MTQERKILLYIILCGVLIFIILPLVLNYGRYSMVMLLAIPFGIGFNFALIVSIKKINNFGNITLLSFIPILLSIISCVIIAKEGAICMLIMGLFLLAPYYLGIVIGNFVQQKIWIKNGFLILILVSIITSAFIKPKYCEPRIVVDEIIIDVSNQQLWTQLVDTVTFGASNNYFFKNGVSYPKQMYLESLENKKYLYCNYNNGFVKAPIIDFKENSYFMFTLGDSLISMKEKNFYNQSHTMHIQHHFEVNYGKFEIIKLDSHRCKLIASTSYKHRFKPVFYTDVWVDYFVHQLHKHVLVSIKNKVNI